MMCFLKLSRRWVSPNVQILFGIAMKVAYLVGFLPSEPGKCKVVSLKGQKTCQIVTGSDRQNTTVLAAVSASGKALPPLILFKGQQVQTTWRPSRQDREYFPWIYANSRGWMTGDTFHKWFIQWKKVTRTTDEDGLVEPRLMIYNTIKFSRKNKITILKLPPHSTDLLQPLDVSVFKSLKEHWGRILFSRLRMTNDQLSKPEFASILSSDEVWAASLSIASIKNGFRRCGISPVDCSQYPTNRFNTLLKNRYDTWVAEGKNHYRAKSLTVCLNFPRVSPKVIDQFSHNLRRSFWSNCIVFHA
eukprot:TCONS_00014297-protein